MALLSYNQGCQLSSTVRQTAAIKSHLTPSLNTCLSSWQAFVLASSDVNSVILKVGNGSARAKKKKKIAVRRCVPYVVVLCPLCAKWSLFCRKLPEKRDNEEEIVQTLY